MRWPTKREADQAYRDLKEGLQGEAKKAAFLVILLFLLSIGVLTVSQVLASLAASQ